MEYNQATRRLGCAVYWSDLKALFAREKGGGHCRNE